MFRPPILSAVSSSSSPAPAIAAPVAPAERAAVLDALRGFALFGILVANFMVMARWGAEGAPDPASFPTAATDPTAHFLQVMLVEGKFYSIFSLLFGIGFAVQLQRAEERGQGNARYALRLLVLLAIGMMHLAFVYTGDILALYAVVGFLLIPLRRLPNRAVLWLAGALLIVPVAVYAAYWAWNWGIADPLWDLGEWNYLRLGPPELTGVELWRSGDWGLFLQQRQMAFMERVASLVEEMRPAKVLALFLVGLWVGRRRLYANLDEAAPLLRRVAAWGLAVGLSANALMAWLDGQGVLYGAPPDYAGTGLGLLQVTAYAVGVAPLGVAYAALFALAWGSARGRRAVGWLAPAGRMALTNYLAQSFIMIAVLFGAGLGLIGRIGPTVIWPLAFAIVVGQAALSAAWLTRFRFGPAEWLWRSLTYGRAQPMRRTVDG